MSPFFLKARKELAPDRVRADYLSAEQYMTGCDQVWSTDRRSDRRQDRSAPCPGQVVYFKSDHTEGFFRQLAGVRSRVVCVSAESDDTISERQPIPPQVGAWFSVNSVHPHVRAIPLGLGNSYCAVTAKAPELAGLAECAKPGLLYLNFNPSTNPTVRLPLWETYADPAKAEWATCRNGGTEKTTYLQELASHRFVLCPEGNGIDTHRMWEALYVGTIPIVRRHPALSGFSDLPILFVDSLHNINRNDLLETERLFVNKEWNYEKLFVSYWLQAIRKEKQKLIVRGQKLSIPKYFLTRCLRSILVQKLIQ